MTEKHKIALCYTALVIATIFLVVAVDYIPHIVCWMPLIVTAYAVAQCKAFKTHFDNLMNNIIP